ncbi:NAD(P)/FAD-dependent oxidoreductase [Salinicola acroporae]|nr:NAD(P)/FAD-dependent oxidoreductase [Salinicola acroporae]
MHDVIVIGGGYAGMAAALQLLRARRRVLVIDAGMRRNRFARHTHGFLGRDGIPSNQIVVESREQLAMYPDLVWVDDEAVSVSGVRDNFEVSLRRGQIHPGRRILFATGVRDTLPAIEGIEARWGRSVFHCPYCHGYELDQGPIGVLGSSPMSAHQAELLTEWGTITFLPNDATALNDTKRDALQASGVTIENTAIERLEGEANVRLVDGRLLSFVGLFVSTTVSPVSDAPVRAGCELEETPLGTMLRTDATQQTTIPGIYACGDVTDMPHSVSLAIGSGAMAGAQVHFSLVWPDA